MTTETTAETSLTLKGVEPGTQVELRNGQTAMYLGPATDEEPMYMFGSVFTHHIQVRDQETGEVETENYTDSGRWQLMKGEHPLDVVKINTDVNLMKANDWSYWLVT